MDHLTGLAERSITALELRMRDDEGGIGIEWLALAAAVVVILGIVASQFGPDIAEAISNVFSGIADDAGVPDLAVGRDRPTRGARAAATSGAPSTTHGGPLPAAGRSTPRPYRKDNPVRIITATVAAAALLLAGCADDEGPELDVAAEDPPPEEDAPEEDAPEEVEPSDDEPDATEDAEEGRAEAWPDPIALDASGRNPGGASVELFELRVSGSSIDIDVRVTNGQSNRFRMNGRTDPLRLEDDLGNAYPVVPPVDDELLRVEAGEVLEGTLSFVGPLDPDATTLDFVMHQEQADEDQASGSNIPHIRIEGMPLTAAEDADA